ncbi:hypothetical protein ABW19_dt0200583 [Dactylella cylindrospora]|nr:hypothetical protein ABW19_dt0200583 [Dactylella cylindrospora]
MAVIWGLDLKEIQWNKFASKNMFDKQWYLRREKMIIYQLAMIFMVVSESVGTAAMSAYIDQQEALERLFPGTHMHNNDIVGIASFNIFMGVSVATIFGAAFFFDLFWPDRKEDHGVKLAWRISAVAVSIGTLADAIAFTVIAASHRAYADGIGVPEETLDQLLLASDEPNWQYRKNARVIASVVLLWPGWVFTCLSTYILFKFYDYLEKFGPKSPEALNAERDVTSITSEIEKEAPTPTALPESPQSSNYFNEAFNRAETAA